MSSVDSGSELWVLFFDHWQFFPFTPFGCIACSIRSNHALLQAFCTSGNITYAVFLSFLISWVVWSRIMRWSQVALPGIPPDWASVGWTSFFTLSLMNLSNTFPGLLASVILLSFEHFPWFLFLCMIIGYGILSSFFRFLLFHEFCWRLL